MDISTTIQANSLQINADDFVAPITVTITNVEAGTSEQPVFLHVAEFPGRTYRPGKSMRRVLVNAWGSEAAAYIGRQLTLYNDPTIRFGRDVTGGIRISNLSHIDGPLTIALTVTRGKRAPFVVQPLETVPERDWLTELKQTNGDTTLILALGKAARASGADATTIAKLTDAYKTAKDGA